MDRSKQKQTEMEEKNPTEMVSKYTETDKKKDINGHKRKEADINGQKRTETDRNRQKRKETDRNGQ